MDACGGEGGATGTLLCTVGVGVVEVTEEDMDYVLTLLQP
jgi:hypothetical protein